MPPVDRHWGRARKACIHGNQVTGVWRLREFCGLMGVKSMLILQFIQRFKEFLAPLAFLGFQARLHGIPRGWIS